ncbi:DUF3054 domain-containing protein [Gulosibacter molinativorax]|uniref:DUF3054 domain-containing protein n=1 Tax=Gulosibacter molinativorax TaxID=256821 RepID=A0ABT7C460_9MICO|nr:DUF3054 domain-containing protein [Gulosibacter molinativorax]MDJ1370008.1 DUF3054 domain-containing protein [Gulosibacter molinativorax]QUY63802.1 Hypothetical protein GMOLON4_3129 [Gulosibacter molinativorax]
MQKIRSAYTRKAWIPLVVDVILVIVFAATGRSSHDESLGPIAILGTAAPFLAALVIAWLIVRLTKLQPSAAWPPGVLIYAVTLTSGLALRILFGATAAVPFILVTAGVLAVFLILPRLLLHSKRALGATSDVRDAEETTA